MWRWDGERWLGCAAPGAGHRRWGQQAAVSSQTAAALSSPPPLYTLYSEGPSQHRPMLHNIVRVSHVIQHTATQVSDQSAIEIFTQLCLVPEEDPY